jgi:hypothetical protein
MQKQGDKKLSKAVSTKLTYEDYELVRRIARESYIKGEINSPSLSELTRVILLRMIDTRRPHKGIPRDAQHPKSYRFKRPS